MVMTWNPEKRSEYYVKPGGGIVPIREQFADDFSGTLWRYIRYYLQYLCPWCK
jgi:hypothetical protein